MRPNVLKLIICLFVLFITIIGNTVLSQSLPRTRGEVKYLNADNLTRYDHLEGNFLYDIYGDKGGHVWITVQYGGLYKFDGYKLEEIYHDPNDTTSMAASTQTTIVFEDCNDDVWVGGQHAIFKYTPEKNAFNSNRISDQYTRENVIHILPWAFKEDPLGNIYIGMYPRDPQIEDPAMLYYDVKDEKLKKLQTKNGIELKNVFKLALGADNNIWALNHDGVFRIDENKVVHRFSKLPDYYIGNHENGGEEDLADRLFTDMKNDAEGVIWFTTNKAELYSFDPNTQKLEVHHLSPTIALDFPGPIANANDLYWQMDFDKEGNIYVASHLGLLYYDPHTKTSWIFEQDIGPVEGTQTVDVDAFGNVWIVSGNGIFYKYNPKSLFKNIPLKRVNINGVMHTNQYRFFQHNDSTVLMSGVPPHYSPINQINFSNGKLEEYSYDTHFSGFSNVHITGAVEKGKYLFNADQGSGIFENELSHSILSTYNSLPDPDGLYRLKFVKDSRENLWWYSGVGLYLQLKDEQQFRHFDLTVFPGTNNDSNKLRAVYEGKNGRIWIPTWNGLFGYDYKTDKLERYLNKKEEGDVLFSQFINTLYEDNDNVLWIGTHSGGLSKYNLITKELKNYTIGDGLPSRTVRGMLHDPIRGDLWLGTTKGISKFNIKEETFVNFTVKDGLESMLFGVGSSFKTVDGYFVFGSFWNLTYFHPEDFYALSEAPIVSLTDINIGDQSIFDKPEIVPKFTTSTVKNLKLNYEQNSLSFEYKAINYDDPEANHYAYKLENYDEEWQEAGSNRKAFYSNLPTGDYAFSLKAANKYGMWSEPTVFANFSISPPWWATWWAYTLYILSGMALLFSIYRFQLNRSLDKAEAKRLQELDAVKNRLYTNITHEFRTPLTVINGMTDQIEENPKDWFKDGLSMIRRNTNRLLELVNQMLDLTKLESGKIALHNQQGDIITYLKYLVESIHSFAESKKIQVHFHEEGEELMMDFDPEKIQQILINLLSNAVKFTPAEGHIYVHVRAVVEKDSPQQGSKLQIKVKNTGAGIPEDQLPYIFDRFYQVDDSTTRAGEGSGIGLALVKELVKLMKGEISVKSNPDSYREGKVTEFTILLPISNVAPEGQLPVPSFKNETAGLAAANTNNNSTKPERAASAPFSNPSILLSISALAVSMMIGM